MLGEKFLKWVYMVLFHTSTLALLLFKAFKCSRHSSRKVYRIRMQATGSGQCSPVTEEDARQDKKEKEKYSQQSPCVHLAIMIIRTGNKFPAKVSYRRLIAIKSCYYWGLSLLRTLTRGPESVRNKAS